MGKPICSMIAGDLVIAERIWTIIRTHLMLRPNDLEIKMFPGEVHEIEDRIPFIEEYVFNHINELIACPIYRYDWYLRQEVDTGNYYLGIHKVKK